MLLNHKDGLENYTDEVVELWRNYGGDADDFLKLVDEFGEEFVEAFKANGDEAVEKFWRLLERQEDLDIDSIINSIPSSLKTFGKCDEFAQSFVDLLESNGVDYKIIRIDSEFGIYSDKAGMYIGTGYHYGVQVGNIVYDNMTTDGMQLDAWLEDLGLTQGIESIKWYYTDTIINY